MKSWIKYTLIAAAIIAGGALFYKKVYVVKSTFEMTQPTKGDLKVSVKGIGNVDAKNIYAITAQSGGRIDEIHFDEGMWVKKGDFLLSIDAVELPSLIGEAKATLQKSSHEAASAKENIASLDAQKVLFEATHERYKKLLEQKFVSQSGKSMQVVHCDEAQLDVIAELFNDYRIFYQLPSDVPACRAFIQQNLQQKRSVIFLLLDQEGRAVGFSQLYPAISSLGMSPYHYLSDLYVAKSERQHGYARHLITGGSS